MFFSRLALFLAHIGFWLGLLYLGFCSYLVFAMPEFALNEDGTPRFLAVANFGEAIDEAFFWLFGSIVLGVLSEIGTRIGKDSNLALSES